MRSSSSGGFKLTTVICVVIIMAITAFLSGNSVAENKDVEKTQAEE
ncbi:hypothetical protein [Colwellia ponticola]|nr:hypothetical protein [Colwellia ponticola]